MLIAYIVPAFALIAAFVGFPSYGFYQILKIVTCIETGVLAYMLWNNKQTNLALLNGLMSIVFCPFFHITFKRSGWQIIDVVAAVIMFAGIHCMKRKQ